MKAPYKLIALTFLVAILTSCSRQLTSISSNTKLQAVSAPVNKTQPVDINQIDICLSGGKTIKEPINSGSINAISQVKIPDHILSHRASSQNVVRIVQKELASLNSFEMQQKHIMDRGEPEVNKAGFILIAAGILALVFHLIWVAGVVMIVLGLIVLLSPLFRKRY